LTDDPGNIGASATVVRHAPGLRGLWLPAGSILGVRCAGAVANPQCTLKVWYDRLRV